MSLLLDFRDQLGSSFQHPVVRFVAREVDARLMRTIFRFANQFFPHRAASFFLVVGCWLVVFFWVGGWLAGWLVGWLVGWMVGW